MTYFCGRWNAYMGNVIGSHQTIYVSSCNRSNTVSNFIILYSYLEHSFKIIHYVDVILMIHYISIQHQSIYHGQIFDTIQTNLICNGIKIMFLSICYIIHKLDNFKIKFRDTYIRISKIIVQ